MQEGLVRYDRESIFYFNHVFVCYPSDYDYSESLMIVRVLIVYLVTYSIVKLIFDTFL